VEYEVDNERDEFHGSNQARTAWHGPISRAKEKAQLASQLGLADMVGWRQLKDGWKPARNIETSNNE
jgi:hypothetical protein